MPLLLLRLFAIALLALPAAPAAAQTLVSGTVAVDETLVGARYRALGTTANGAQRLFLGIPDLGVGARRVETGGNYGAYSAPVEFRVELDRAGNRMLARINNGTDLVYPSLAAQLGALTGGVYGLDDLNVLRFALQTTSTTGNNGQLVVSNLQVNGTPMPGFSIDGNASSGTVATGTPWSIVDVCLGAGNGFVVTGTITRSGTLSNSAEGNKLEIGAAVSASRGLRCTSPSDLAVSGSASPEPAPIGGGLAYAVTATNNGPGPTPATTLRLTLPSPLEYVADDSGCSYAAPVLTCALGGLASGAARTVNVTASAPIDAAPGIVVANAQLSSPIFDGNPLDNVLNLQSTLADLTPPVVLSLARIDPDPSAATSVRWLVSFSEPVTGVEPGDFALAPGGTLSGAVLADASGAGAAWTITASTGTGSGALGITLVDDDSIIDGNGNPLAGVGVGNGTFIGEAYTIDRTAPVVTAVRGVGQFDDGEIPADATVDAALTRLLVVFDKPMDVVLAGDSTNYRLLAPGGDGSFATLDCVGSAGDDVEQALGPGAWLPLERSGVLAVVDPLGLRPGAYRLIACPVLADAVGNTLAAPLLRDFDVALDNRLPNPNFDVALSDWVIATPGAGAGVALVAVDAIGTAASAAAAITAADGIGDYTLTQCLPLPALSAYGTGARARVQGNASIRVEARSYAEVGCTGAVLATRTADGPAGDTVGAFVRFDGVATGGLPGDAASIELRYVVSLAAPGATVTFDSAYFDLRATFDGVFDDGFESAP